MLPEFKYKLQPYSERTNPVETIRRGPAKLDHDIVRTA
jgi:hypothetical protein